jgi:hypothetical protein
VLAILGEALVVRGVSLLEGDLALRGVGGGVRQVGGLLFKAEAQAPLVEVAQSSKQ